MRIIPRVFRILPSARRTALIGAVVGPLAAAGVSSQLFAQAAEGAAARTATARDTVPLPVYDALGTYSRRITTRSAEAQTYFDQGLRLTFGFGHVTSRKSFREATARDSTCAMCWWGLAWALGPYINGQMDSTGGVEAYRAIQNAQRHANAGTPVERALIGAMSARYVEIPVRATRKSLDTAYVEAMRQVVRQHPNDLDAAALLGEAMMVLSPWDHWTRSGEPKPGTADVLRTLESVLARNPRHPGACHHYIHATEASTAPQRAAACADLLGAIIPGASHIPHMPSHTYMRMGRYGDAVRANQDAVIADIRAAYGGAPGVYPPHNLNMLLAAAAMDGQSGVSLQAARDLDVRYPSTGSWEPLILARFGRWDEILAATPPTGGLLHATAGAFARGLARLAQANRAAAAGELRILDALLAGVAEGAREGGHPARSMIGIPRAILSAEIAAERGRFDDAVKTLEAAVVLEDSLNYDEPEPWPIPVRHVLGAVLLEAMRAPEAEAVYRADLVDHPANGWALDGLVRALRAQGRQSEADTTAKELVAVWKRSDVWLTGSQAAPRRTP